MVSYNPNTKYGRRKNREQAQINIDNYNDDEKFQFWLFKAAFVIIVLVICFIIIALGGKI